MQRFLSLKYPQCQRKDYLHFLAFFWLLGYLCGICTALRAEYTSFLVMRSVLSAPVSIVCLLFTAVFPFLISEFALSRAKPGFLLLIAFLRAFVFAVVSAAVTRGFGSAGWLIRFFLLFGDCFTVPLVYLFWMRSLSPREDRSGARVFFFSSIAILIAVIQYRIISPFLASLIEI